ncbi:hypothetical protein CAL29_22880 [Bordetella genomosp. 10]|uniref:Glycosyl hydrolase 94 catalytic domain-containing protein n=1 Tax=Bordetella genomosp. 10 TaxID=1416804 RepID=A0A261S0X8_9BORD|nr:hypothetical protein CAL29_22880 [Bordetella genomosp. 10]
MPTGRRLHHQHADAVILFTPPFDHTPRDPGYIKGYPPGLRENGGQYSHAAMWAILALTQLRTDPQAGAHAHALFALVNPIHHAARRSRRRAMWWRPTCIRCRRTQAGAAGRGTPAPPAGCIARVWKASWAFAAKARS